MDEWKKITVEEIIANPVSVGIGRYPQIVPDEVWIRSAEKLIAEIGAGPFLATVIMLLRRSFRE